MKPTLTNLLKDISRNKNSNLKFLETSINFRNHLYDSVKDKGIQKIPSTEIYKQLYSKNFIREEDSCIFLEDTAWLDLQKTLKNLQNELLNEKIEKSKNISFKNEKLLSELFEIFEEFNNKLPSLKHPEIALLDLEPKIVSISLYKQLQNLVVGKAIRKEFKYDLNKLYLKFTNTAYSIGLTLIILFLQKNKSYLKNILLNAKVGRKMTLQELEKFEILILSLLKKDNRQASLIINELFEVKVATNKLLKTLFENYLLAFALERYLQNDTEFRNINEEIRQLYPTFEQAFSAMLSFKEKTHEIYIQLGAPILQDLENRKVLDIKVLDMDQHKKPKVIYFKEEDFIFSFLSAASSTTPFLSESFQDTLDLDYIFDNIHVYSDLDHIHKHPEFHTQIKKDTYLNKKLPMVKLSIDDDALVIFLTKNILPYVGLTYDQVINNTSLSLDTYLFLFDISLNEVFNLDDISEKPLAIRVINYALDFNTLYDNDLVKFLNKEKEKKESKKLVEHYIKIYYKIVSYKTFLLGMIKEAIIYSLFGFIMFPEFMDARLRKYMHGYFLNLQNFPIIKTIVKFYDPTKANIKENFKSFKKAVGSVLFSKLIKDKITSMSYETFNNLILEYTLYILIANFNNIKIQDLKTFIETKPAIDEIWTYVKTYIKDFTLLPVMVSFIYRIIYPSPFLTNILGLDACNSGVQMVSILFYILSTGKLTNLTGEFLGDLYQLAADFCGALLTELDPLIDQFCKSQQYVYRYKPCSLKIDPKQMNNPIDLLDFLMNDIISTEYYFRHVLRYLASKLTIDIDLITKLAKFEFLILPKDRAILKKELGNDEILNDKLTALTIIRNALRLFHLCKRLNMDYKKFDRKLFKSAIMTEPYNATSFGRKDNFKLYITNKLQKFNNITQEELHFMCDYLENLFMRFKTDNFEPLEKLKDLSDILSQMQKPIIIDNRYATIRFSPYKKKSSIVTVTSPYTGKRILQLTTMTGILTNTSGKLLLTIEPRTIRQKFGANFIHTMDAMIVHLYMDKISQINHLLSHNNLFINTFSNHDAYYITVLPWLRDLVRDCYLELYDMDYLSTLKGCVGEENFKKIEALKIQSTNRERYLTNAFDNDGFLKA